MSPAGKPITFSVALFPYDRWGGIEPISKAVQRAEELGYHAIQFPEHIIMPVRPGQDPVSAVWYDNFILATHLATLTQRVRFNFHVTVVPYRPPVQQAKMIATMDQVSKGRLTLGVGIGWMKGEFRTLGLPFQERAAITDDYLRAMKALWTQERPAYAGKYTSFANIAFEPKCRQRPHVPIWVGGSGPGPMRRLLEFGDGWAPMVGELDDLARDVSWVKEQLQSRGRDPQAFDFAYSITVGEEDATHRVARSHVTAGTAEAATVLATPEQAIDQIGRFREAGFTHLAVRFNWTSPGHYMEQAAWFAERVMARAG